MGKNLGDGDEGPRGRAPFNVVGGPEEKQKDQVQQRRRPLKRTEKRYQGNLQDSQLRNGRKNMGKTAQPVGGASEFTTEKKT